jgi:hypothetical protein
MLRKSSTYFFVKLAENQANWINWQEKLNDSSFLHAEEVRHCSRAIGNLLIQKKARVTIDGLGKSLFDQVVEEKTETSALGFLQLVNFLLPTAALRNSSQIVCGARLRAAL